MNVNLATALAIAAGASLGALSRWGLSLAFNSVLPQLPLGTLASNLIGGLLMGVSIALLADFEGIPLPLRLGIMTGFLGGLTTFSAFSAETISLLLREQWAWTLAIVVAHVGGTLLATMLGIGVIRLWLRN